MRSSTDLTGNLVVGLVLVSLTVLAFLVPVLGQNAPSFGECLALEWDP